MHALRWGLAAVAAGVAVAVLWVTAPNGETGPAPSSVGGPFTLVAHTGETVTEADFLDKPTVYYFGFTYCPDVCPMGLQSLARALQIADLDAGDVNSVFVSVDPERDTPEAMASYVSADVFPPGLVGLTGNEEQVAAAAQAFRVYYQRVDTPESAADYLIDHSSILYLMDAQGRFVEPFTHADAPEDIAAGLTRLLAGS